jgi:hypothetical protein
LEDVCWQISAKEFDLKIPVVLRTLSESDITATAEKSIKEIAAQNNKNPMDIYDILKTLN